MKIDFEDAFARFLIAQLSFDNGRYKQALSELQLLSMKERPDYLSHEEIFFWTAKTYLMLGQKDKANKYFNLLLGHPEFGRLAKSYLAAS